MKLVNDEQEEMQTSTTTVDSVLINALVGGGYELTLTFSETIQQPLEPISAIFTGELAGLNYFQPIINDSKSVMIKLFTDVSLNEGTVKLTGFKDERGNIIKIQDLVLNFNILGE